MMTNESKQHIRQKIVQQRNNLNTQSVLALSQKICDNVLSHSYFSKSQTIAIYYALDHEVKIISLVNANQTFAMPVIQANKKMVFKSFNNQSNFTKNQYGILEPKNGHLINPKEIDLCLLPLVGFNRNGSRLGMGEGYYDRFFEFNHSQIKPTILAGIAYDFQEDDTIVAESWDIPLDIIFTNKEVIIP